MPSPGFVMLHLMSLLVLILIPGEESWLPRLRRLLLVHDSKLLMCGTYI